MDDLTKIYNWCADEYGFSKYQADYPTISADNRGKKLHGWFDSDANHIHIYLNMNPNKTDLTSTVIHEWIHYLQSPSWLSRYTNTHEYEKNPYEIQAFKVSEQDCVRCFVEILRK